MEVVEAVYICIYTRWREDSGRRPRRGHTWRKLGDVNIDECARPGPRLTSTDAATFPSGVTTPDRHPPAGWFPPALAVPYRYIYVYMQHSYTVVAESYYLEYTYIQYNIYARRKKERKRPRCAVVE